MATSPNKRYTVLDWALWAREKGKPGADDLVRYLHAVWPAIPANHYSFRAKKRNVGEDALAVGLPTPSRTEREPRLWNARARAPSSC